jgi:hypothetical protein
MNFFFLKNQLIIYDLGANRNKVFVFSFLFFLSYTYKQHPFQVNWKVFDDIEVVYFHHG